MANHGEAGDVERFQEVVERVGVILAVRRIGPQIVAEHIARSVPRDDVKPPGKPGQLIAPMQRVRADAMQKHDRR